MLKDRIINAIQEMQDHDIKLTWGAYKQKLSDKIIAAIPEITPEWLEQKHIELHLDDRVDYLLFAGAINKKIRGKK